MIEIQRLTQFSPGAGCGCKISPKDLEEILKSETAYTINPNLLVGNSTKDDAAVFDLGNGTAIISTTDFFTPIVDDPFDFGRIAAVNAISDIYAMGGKPLMAIAILGWPLTKLPVSSAQKVLEGARSVCESAGISLAGGHSIEISDPVFGLAVTGIVDTQRVKQNNKARKDSKLFLTKPLGIGIIATAEKRDLVDPDDTKTIIDLMTSLNKVGQEISKFNFVNAITDVTGFGLIGHLLELCEGSKLNALVFFDKVPKIKNLQKYIDLKTFPGGLLKNFNSYGHKVHELTDNQKYVMCDPQTSGGLLISVDKSGVQEFINFMNSINHEVYEIGELNDYDGSGKFIKVV